MSHEGLAGVQQDLAALDNHALDGEVLPDVLRLAHFVMHYPAGTGNKSEAAGGEARPLARPSGKAWLLGFSEPAVTKGRRPAFIEHPLCAGHSTGKCGLIFFFWKLKEAGVISGKRKWRLAVRKQVCLM